VSTTTASTSPTPVSSTTASTRPSPAKSTTARTVLASPTPAAPPAAAPGQQLPLPYSGSAGQVITVVGASSASTTAQLTAWTRNGTGWTRAIGPITANVGSAGIGKASESTTRTPAGVFGLTEAFGILADNGTRLPYRQVDTSDWWVSDVNSAAYNTYYRCAPGTCPFNESAGENLGKAGTAYNHAVVINYNRNPVTPGAGSAFFLHVSTGRATAGCVAVPTASLDAIMRWLDPTQHPVIDIGVA
jgi:L,D-peptidoglycan transpeptidase YkuD (ErfK/YbiS/YcfS/YnhG family)